MTDEPDPMLDSATAIGLGCLQGVLGLAFVAVATFGCLWFLLDALTSMPSDYRASHGIRGTFVPRASDCDGPAECLTTGDVRLPSGEVVEEVRLRDVAPAGESTVSVVRHNGRYVVHGSDARDHWHEDLAEAATMVGMLLAETVVVVLVVRARRRDVSLQY
ncbi:MAG TPA: hypothetical protein VFQ85_02645 [Mycobacteriales bacterium]|jgi:hypothetical protein|nr:hypothetical protein [Mycobacteriales bacterium]